MMLCWLLLLFVQVSDAFVLVSNYGDITLLGPVDIDPALEDPKINLRKDGVIKWTIKTM